MVVRPHLLPALLQAFFAVPPQRGSGPPAASPSVVQCRSRKTWPCHKSCCHCPCRCLWSVLSMYVYVSVCRPLNVLLLLVVLLCGVAAHTACTSNSDSWSVCSCQGVASLAAGTSSMQGWSPQSWRNADVAIAQSPRLPGSPRARLFYFTLFIVESAYSSDRLAALPRAPTDAVK